MVEGKVLEILKSDTTVGGKSVRASEDSPQLRLESSKSGKEVCYILLSYYLASDTSNGTLDLPLYFNSACIRSITYTLKIPSTNKLQQPER